MDATSVARVIGLPMCYTPIALLGSFRSWLLPNVREYKSQFYCATHRFGCVDILVLFIWQTL